MPRKKRDPKIETPLAHWIKEIMEQERLSIREIAKLAGGVATSTVHGWIANSSAPSDMRAVQRLANHFGKSLGQVMTGTADQIDQLSDVERAPVFEGLVEVRVMRLIPYDRLLPKKKV